MRNFWLILSFLALFGCQDPNKTNLGSEDPTPIVHLAQDPSQFNWSIQGISSGGSNLCIGPFFANVDKVLVKDYNLILSGQNSTTTQFYSQADCLPANLITNSVVHSNSQESDPFYIFDSTSKVQEHVVLTITPKGKEDPLVFYNVKIEQNP